MQATYVFLLTNCYFEVDITGEPFTPAKIDGPPESCYEAEGGEWDYKTVRWGAVTPSGNVERELTPDECDELGIYKYLEKKIEERLTKAGFYR